MKSEIIEATKEYRDPLKKGNLVKHNISDTIILVEEDFGTGRFSGTVIHSERHDFEIGTYSKTWNSCAFVYFDKALKLQN